MSIRITGNGIESDGDFELKSLAGDIKMNDTVTDLPSKSSSKMKGSTVLTVGTDEEVICSKLDMADSCCLHITGDGHMRMI